MKIREFTKTEVTTAKLLLLSALFNGVVQSLAQTQDIIARKALHAEAWQLTVMAMIWPVSNLMSIWWGCRFEKSNHKSRYFVLVGIFGRLTLIWGLWLSGMNQFMLVLGLMFSFNALLIPAQNCVYQRNIPPDRRGKLYGYTMSLGLLVTVLFTFIAGRMLDIDENRFRLILAATAVCGFIASILLSFIKLEKAATPSLQCAPTTWVQDMIDPLFRSLLLLKKNKQFAAFERSFSIYGMGFIIVQPVLPIFLVDMLKLSYTNNFLAKGIISQIPMLLLSPLLGRWHDRLHPFRFISASFTLLAFFPLLLISSYLALGSGGLPVILIYAAFTIFGFAMTGVNIAWNMGSIYFAGEQDASLFQSVHVTMTGIRGVIAPLLGLLIMKTMGIVYVFVASFIFLTTAAIISYRDYMRLHPPSV